MTATTLFTGCGHNEKVYDRFISTPRNGWEKSDFVSFEVPPLDTPDDYLISLKLRTDNDFPFTSVTMVVDNEILPRGTVISDTVVCRIADTEGHLLGQGINIYQYSFPVRQCRLQKGDSLNITVHHCMKREILPGITDLGITIKLVQETLVAAGINSQEDE